MSVAAPEAQSALVYDLGVSTIDVLAALRGRGHYELLLTERVSTYTEITFIYAAVPFSLGLLSLLAGIFYCVCSLRLCQRCRASCRKCLCCWAKREEDSYHKRHSEMALREKKKKRIRCQYTCLTALSFIMLAFAVLGYMANGQFSDSVVETGGALDITSDYFSELKGFIRTTREPLQYIGKHVSTVIGTVILPLLDDSILIAEGTSGLTARLGNFSTAYENMTVNASDGTYHEVFDCHNCSIICAQVNAAKEQIDEETGPMLSSIEQTRISLGAELVQQNNTIVSVCSSVDELIGAAETGVDAIITS
eukprot:TRINITY_DN761_c0_g1_i1.p1 TRINITY_DN761_c0_g1~~TRINITY_DN761_c0_g1_i1.p1  ORF type:complete len:308 (-),score=20.61 TRINITY_DN761_c0_g1_i1:71-994(-)